MKNLLTTLFYLLISCSVLSQNRGDTLFLNNKQKEAFITSNDYLRIKLLNNEKIEGVIESISINSLTLKSSSIKIIVPFSKIKTTRVKRKKITLHTHNAIKVTGITSICLGVGMIPATLGFPEQFKSFTISTIVGGIPLYIIGKLNNFKTYSMKKWQISD